MTDLWRKDFVVLLLIEILGLLLRHGDQVYPFDPSRSRVARNDDAEWKSVVRFK